MMISILMLWILLIDPLILFIKISFLAIKVCVILKKCHSLFVFSLLNKDDRDI